MYNFVILLTVIFFGNYLKIFENNFYSLFINFYYFLHMYYNFAIIYNNL